jgi:hypothetical protein
MAGNMTQRPEVFRTNNKISNVFLFCYDVERKAVYTKETSRPFRSFILTVEATLQIIH